MKQAEKIAKLFFQSTVATSSMKSIPAVKLETSTPATSGNPVSTSVDKALPVPKPVPKSKLPVGVPPIPIMIDQKLENREEKQDEVARKKEEPKQKINVNSKEQEGENGNLDPPFPAVPARRADDQVPDRRGNGWFNVGPGIQEIGDELNHIRLAGYVSLKDNFIFLVFSQFYTKFSSQFCTDILEILDNYKNLVGFNSLHWH